MKNPFATTLQPELHLEPPSLTVDPKYDDYLATLTTGVADRWAKVNSQLAYLEQVLATGVNAAATSGLAERVNAEVKALSLVDEEVERVRKVLAYGCEPTSLPTKWWCGHLEVPTPPYHNEKWPSQNTLNKPFSQAINDRLINRPFITYSYSDLGGQLEYTTSLVFKSPVPVEVLEAYAATKPLFDGVRVYSPAKEDFEQLANPIPHDPVLIGRVRAVGENRYFEIARWDIDRDLASLFSQ